METITITCTNNDRTKEADVLERTDKYMKVQSQELSYSLRCSGMT